jgi:ATP synthase protein I
MKTLPTNSEKLLEFNKKMMQARGKEKNTDISITNQKNMSYVWRMVLELVIGMVIGVGLGFSLDQWLGTAPLMIIIMSLFGFAAGIRTMMITASEYAALEKNE